jgi:large subunit ribosomal protein L18
MQKDQQKIKRQVRIRKKIRATADSLRLTVFRSNKHIYAQIIDDAKRQTLVSAREAEKGKNTKTERARAVGMDLAKAALAKKITAVVFDKGSYSYHGRVKALAEGAREGGLTF